MFLTQALTELRIAYAESGHHHCRPGWVQIDCPYCGRNSGRYHMGLNIQSLYAHCWKCGSHPIRAALAEASSQPYSLVAEMLRRIERPRQLRDTDKRIASRALELPDGIGPMARQHRRYLRGRGFDPNEIERVWKVEGIGLSARLGWRLFIPIYLGEDVVSWTTRTIGNCDPRYISASPDQERFPHKDVLYGEHLAGHAIVVVEGPADAWKIGPGAVATFGTSFSSSQVLRMADHPIRVICFDKGSEAQKRAKDLASALSVFPGETYVVELDADDPGSADENEIRELRERFLN